MRARRSSIRERTSGLHLALLLGAGLSACGEPPSPPAGEVDGGRPDAALADAAMAGATAFGPAQPAALDDFAQIPVNAAVQARQALAAARPLHAADSAPYLAFRRAIGRGEPCFRTRGFVTEALFGEGPQDETGGPLGRLDAAMTSGDAKAVAVEATSVDLALQLLEDSFRRSPARRGEAAALLPRAAYTLGAVIAESKPGVASTGAAVIADALGLLDAIEGGVKAYSRIVSPSQDFGVAAADVAAEADRLRAALEAAQAGGELRDRAALIVVTGRLGAGLRAMLGPSAWRPYQPKVLAAKREGDEPSSVFTVPALHRFEGLGDREAQERLAERGKALFFDKGLSAGNVRSCATCHVPEKGYADGKVRSESLDPATPLLRNTPTLLYSPLHAVQFWDGRALTSAAQALLVLHSRAEMGDAAAAFPRPSAATASEASRALAAFEARALVPAGAPIDRFARGDDTALSAEDRAGFDVFAGKGRCARCHVPPLFGGSYPTDFATPIYAALGVPEAPSGKKPSADRGRGGITRRPLDEGSFKTPTVRNVDKTAPFFHNGAFPTLELVVDFYDRGGGAGLGLGVPNQDPEVRVLKLTQAEKKALLRFLRVALADPAAAIATSPR